MTYRGFKPRAREIHRNHGTGTPKQQMEKKDGLAPVTPYSKIDCRKMRKKKKPNSFLSKNTNI